MFHIHPNNDTWCFSWQLMTVIVQRGRTLKSKCSSLLPTILSRISKINKKFEINIKKPVTEQRMLKDLVYVSAINDLVFFVHPHFLTKSECQIAQLSAQMSNQTTSYWLRNSTCHSSVTYNVNNVITYVLIRQYWQSVQNSYYLNSY